MTGTHNEIVTRMLDFNLSPDQKKWQQKAREFALNEILPVVRHYDQLDETPVDILHKAESAGLVNFDIGQVLHHNPGVIFPASHL